jgi:putative methyltransferase
MRLKNLLPANALRNGASMNLYSEAAQFIDVSGKGGSIRSIIYNAYEKNKGKLKCDPKRVCALVIETLKYRSILEELIKNSQLLKFEKKVLSCNRIFYESLY